MRTGPISHQIPGRILGGIFRTALPILIVFSVLFPSVPALAARITDIRCWSAPDHTRIVLDLTAPVQYKNASHENPPVFELELKGSLQISRRELIVNDSFLSVIRLTEYRRGIVRIVFHQKKPLAANLFLLKPYQNKPYRLVVDLVDTALEKTEQEERQRQKETGPKGAAIVVVDPGHGGEDPGAIGPQKTLEKDVALEVGQKVVQLLNQNKGTKAFLTRKGDYFIKLEDRVKMANDYGADLFISLHTDATPNPRARGSSVYCLSLAGATDQAAKILADKENLSNILGGAFSRSEVPSKDPNVGQILLDLRQNDTMKQSFRFAELLLSHMKSVNCIKFDTYRQANFIVLRAPHIPSVLIETSFITNREDERLLGQDEFQDKLARAITTSVKEYFNGSEE